MPLPSGTRLGPYEILAAIGAGGMGEVYRARDPRLKREVAIKILPDPFSHDPQRRARFQREAELLAALNHPNIAGIHGFEEADGVHALVLELVDGDTLADVIARGPLPVVDALTIARQIAEALEAAHEKGVIHRDLKPANIKLTADGRVKVLDFGLAKLLEPANPASSAALASTRSAHGTLAGVILGTAAYMSPEQARGKPVDQRTDIWAFGVVLYEMLTGRRAFDGEMLSEVLAMVIEREPDWNALPSATPRDLRRLLTRCLKKDPKERLRDVGDARVEIADLLRSGADEAVSPPTASALPRWQRVSAAAAILLLTAAAAGTAVWYAVRSPAPRVTRLTVTPSAATALTLTGIDGDLGITPDGARVVYVGNNGTQILVRRLDQLEPTVAGAGVPRGIFLSPDSQWIGFTDSVTTLKKIPLAGGPTIKLCDVDGTTAGATWGPDGTIVFATSLTTSGLQRVSAAGGAATVLTKPNRDGGELDHLWPQFLPGGRHVLFTIVALASGIENAQIAVLDLEAGTQKVVARGGSHARYVSSGHLVYNGEVGLEAVAFDLSGLESIGKPVGVVQQVLTTNEGAAVFDVAQDGTLVYVAGGTPTAERTLVWVDRQGREEAVPAPSRAYLYPRISPDGRRFAVTIVDQETNIWMWDRSLTRITVGPVSDNYHTWMPDGLRILFSSERAGARNLFLQLADATEKAARLTDSPNLQSVNSVSPDGTRAVFHERKRSLDLMVLRLDENRRMVPLLQAPFNEWNGEISPNGRWLAYEADEFGRSDIYVRPFPDVNSGRWDVSVGGGTRPLWARNGKEIFYLASDGALMAVPIDQGETWRAGTPAKVLEARYLGTNSGALGRTYDVSPDGKRFLMIKAGGASDRPAASPPIIVVQNWFEELKRLVPIK